jgi:hypothetical protein
MTLPKTFPIKLNVEGSLLDVILRKLHNMPGVVDIGIDLGPAPSAAVPELQKAVVKKSTLIERTANGRAVRGEGMSALRIIIGAAGGPIPRHQLNERLAELGYSERGIQGLMHRCKRAKMLRLGKKGWDLTAKGRKVEGENVDG